MLDRFPHDLPWDDQVHEGAKIALADFPSLEKRFDFTSLREFYPTIVAEVTNAGGDAGQLVFFRWLVGGEEEAKRLRRATSFD